MFRTGLMHAGVVEHQEAGMPIQLFVTLTSFNRKRIRSPNGDKYLCRGCFGLLRVYAYRLAELHPKTIFFLPSV